MLKADSSPLQSYFDAALAVSIAMMINGLLSPVIGGINPFLLFAPAVMVSAFLGGLGPGLLATSLGALAGDFFFVSPLNSLYIDRPADLVNMVVFLLIGLVISWLGTSQREVKEALGESEDRYRDLVENSQNLICTHDLEGVIISVNEGAAKMLGYVPRTLLKRNIRDILVPEFRPEFDTYLKTTRSDGFATGLMQVCTASGERRALEYRSTLRTQGVEAPVVRGVAHDVTARLRAEQALQETTHTLQALIRASPLAVVVLDREGIIRLWNPSAERTFGWGEKEVFGRPLPIVPEDMQQGYAANHETVLKGRFLIDLETRCKTKDGTIIDISLSDAPVYDAKGKISGSVSIIADITERKQAERERERLLASERAARAEAEVASRSKDEFLATVSHELRTPLTSILGWVHILRTGKLDAAKVERGLETIERNSKAQMRLIEDLLDVSRVASGKLRLDTRPVSLLSVITAAIEVVRPAAEAKRVELLMKVDASVGPVQGDPNRLQQVVWNLLSNAVKFTDEGGRIEVKLERADQHAQITVSDTGCGISAEFLPYVFDRFRQASISVSGRHGGLGLGLAIVRHLVEMHGGAVHAQSAGAGRGATFTVRLPLRGSLNVAQPQADEVRDLASSSKQRRLVSHPFVEGLRVMVVDDDAETRGVLLEMLEQYGAEVVVCSSAAEALEMLQWHKPDVLISDIAMPDEDGYSLIKKVRELQPEQGGHTPAVALTAHAKAEDRQRALSAGYELFMPKPVAAEDLLIAIAELAKSAGPYH